MKWIYIFRQLFVCSAVWAIYFVLGLSFGAPTVFIPQIQKEANSTNVISLEMESWLTSIHGYSALPFVIIIPVLTHYIGRKIPFIIVCFNTIVSFIIFYWSSSTLQLLLSEILQGMLLASNITLLIVIITEYTSPQYRGLFMSIQATLFFYGVWAANAVGTFTHWRNIGLIAFGCCAISLSAFFWPESPSWLAMKGRFEKCAATHYWLKGHDKNSEEELRNLIHSQTDYIKECEGRQTNHFKGKMRQIARTARTKSFYQPLLLCLCVMSLYHFSGKMVCTMYAVKLIREITKNEFTSFIGMLILEGVTILGMQIGCILSRYLNRRTLLLFFAGIGIVFLFIISIYLYLVYLGLILENQYLSIALLTAFSVTISIGPMVVPGSLFGELILLRYKSSSLLILTMYSEFLMASVLMIFPHMLKKISLHGVFLFYTISSSIFTSLLFKYLPETKDKSLYEIECYFINRQHIRAERHQETHLINLPTNK